MALRIVFVQSPFQNVFFAELVDALSAALHDVGVHAIATLEPDGHEVLDDDVFVLLPPHEYVALEGDAWISDAVVAARTIGVSAEQPHQTFFERNAAVGAQLGGVLDFSALAVEAYRGLGVDARQLHFGHVPTWDRVGESSRAGGTSRSISALYLGNRRPRRLGTLASAAEVLGAHQARIIVGDNAEPNRASDPNFYSGDRKRDLLADAELIINIHQSDEPYFEWLRFAEAAHCGTPMLTERSVATNPFVDGEHFISFRRDEFPAALRQILDDAPRRREVAAAAYARLVEQPLSESIAVLVDRAEALLDRPPPLRLPARTRTTPIGRDRTPPTASAHPPRGRLDRLRTRRDTRRGVSIVAPAGTTWRVSPEQLLADAQPAPFVSVLSDGTDAAGGPMLEGLWAWEPWRLRYGQHLGRVLVVDAAFERKARAWLSEPIFDAQPHLRIQLYAAVHGIAGAHRACPLATLSVPVDAEHNVPTEVAERCRQLVERVA